LATGLRQRADARILSTRQVLQDRADSTRDREHGRKLQRLGDELDATEGGRWVANSVREALSTPAALLVVDAVRTADQIAAVRALGRVTHIHLSADAEVLSERYARLRAMAPEAELPSFASVRSNATEAAVENLKGLADIFIDTGEVDIDEMRDCALNAVREH
jgi:hypothetical protein